MKKFHLFCLDESMNSYIYPFVKIVLCIGIILLLIFRDHFIQIDQLLWEIIVGVLCVILCFACILCVEISLAELLVVHDNKHKMHKQMIENDEECVSFSVERVVSLTGQNDIIDFEIVSKGTRLNIGASSDNKPGDSVFFDKLYYIGNQEYDNLEIFMEELKKYSIDGQIPVVSIDGVSPKGLCDGDRQR